jgi:hypothetical protein
MNRFPASNQEVQAITEFFAQTNTHPFKPNPNHTCNTHTCRFYRAKNRITVCKQSLQTHRCGKQCDKSTTQQASEGLTCLISGYVVGPPLQFQTPKICQRTKTFKRHWEITSSRKKHNPNTREKIKKQTADAIAAIFTSKQRNTMAKAARQRTAARIAKTLKESKSKIHLFSLMNIAKQEINENKNALTSAAEHVPEKLQENITAQIAKMKQQGLKLKNVPIATAAILSIAQHGLAVKKCTLVEKSHFANTFMPSQQQLGAINSLHARAITLAIRQIKAHLVTKNGLPKPHHAISIN